MADLPQVIILGAGILGLASAYHLLHRHRTLRLLVVDQLSGPGRGNTARSAAAFRDLFSSPLNRALSQGSIAFYEQVHQEITPLGLQKLGYLWLLNGEQSQKIQAVLDSLGVAEVAHQVLEPRQLKHLLPRLHLGDITRGLMGLNCGILNPNPLCRFYADRVQALGGKFLYHAAVTGFFRDKNGRITGVLIGDRVLTADTLVVAAGAWMSQTLALAGLQVPVVPRKRQLFAVPAREGPLHQLLHTPGFNPQGMLPFTILPGGAYFRPATSSCILGYANPDQPPGLEDRPEAEAGFFSSRIRPQVAAYFPAFRNALPGYAWAGHYADYPADSHPFVDRLEDIILVGGTSGSGIMKADSLGRIVAGLYYGQKQVELGQGQPFRVKDLALRGRSLTPEGMII